MWTDLWPLAFMLGLFAALYLISLVLNALGIRPTIARRPGIPFCPEGTPPGGGESPFLETDDARSNNLVCVMNRRQAGHRQSRNVRVRIATR